MNIIFMTLAQMDDVEEHGIYQDLMRKFRNEGHNVYILTPHERKHGSWLKLNGARLENKSGVHILTVNTLKVQKTNIVEKGLGTLLIENQFKNALKKYLSDVKFDLITYSTPPITFTDVVKYLKKKNSRAISYLQLKDIFPQNAVDIGLMSTTGLQGILYWFFQRKEKALYKVSDYIGCMSPANVEFLLKHNPGLDASRIEVAPNSVDISKNENLDDNKAKIRTKYGLPIDRPVFIYGGNLGKPQGIPFLIQCLNANAERQDCHILVIGNGTEQPRMKIWYDVKKPKSVTMMNGLPKTEYDQLVRACDVGLIFLDHRFTIPNFPSRLLSYLENRMPVLCATDPNCDMGMIAESNGFGYWCESNSVEAFTAMVDKMIHADRKTMGEKGYEFLKENYLVQNTYDAIMRHF